MADIEMVVADKRPIWSAADPRMQSLRAFCRLRKRPALRQRLVGSLLLKWAHGCSSGQSALQQMPAGSI